VFLRLLTTLVQDSSWIFQVFPGVDIAFFHSDLYLK
jgi:hypothetical protein